MDPCQQFINTGRKDFLSEMGVKGALPVGCLPLWGREGITLITAENITGLLGEKVFTLKNAIKNLVIFQ